jgi:phage-related protein
MIFHVFFSFLKCISNAARFVDTVYVLHAFQKKTQATSKRDIDIAKMRFTQLSRGEK